MTNNFPPKMPVVVSAAVRRDDQVLFVRGTYGDFLGIWTFPAGFVDEGEMPEAAAIRETMEEAGIACTIEGLMNVTTILWRGAPMLYLVFLARSCSGEPTPDGVETDGAAFLGLDDLKGDRIDGQNAHLARLILTGQAKVLTPQDGRGWNEMYRITWA